jgi:hypothetical protein
MATLASGEGDRIDTLRAGLGDDQLARLERSLAFLVDQLVPGTSRDTREVPGEADEVEVPARDELQAAAEDLLDAARQGIEIRPRGESRPLIPLYEAQGLPVPPELRVDHEHNGYDFYLVEVEFAALLPEDQRPLSAQFGLVLGDDVPEPVRQTRAVRIFPGREDVELFRVDLQGAVGLDAGGRLTVPAVGGSLLSLSETTAEARVKAGIAIGPFSFPFRKAKIEVVGENGPDITWRYDLRSALWGANEFKSILVLKVHRQARDVALGAALRLVPYKRRWLVLKDRLPELSCPSKRIAVELAPSAPGGGGR